MLGFPKWVLAGFLGGLVGAAIWAGISYATNYEIGWIAWGIGFLVGFCVRVAAGGDQEGFAPGATAAVVAIISVLIGKYAAFSLLVSGLDADNFAVNVTADDMIESRAHDIAKARIAAGQSVAFAAGKTLDDADGQADFPVDIWQQATQQWQAVPAADQQKQIDERQQQIQALTTMVLGQMKPTFDQSFSLYDALWFFLAAASAYKLGHGNIASDD